MTGGGFRIWPYRQTGSRQTGSRQRGKAVGSVPRLSPFSERVMLPRYSSAPHRLPLQPAKAVSREFEEILGTKLVSPNGNLTTDEALRNAEYVGLYFSSRWAGTWILPKLAESYTDHLKAKLFFFAETVGKCFPVVFFDR